MKKEKQTAKKIKFFWHMHHDILVEPLTEPIKNRIAYIKAHKPENEIELRLKLLKKVKGKLPAEVIKTWEAHDKARDAYDKAGEACDKAWEAYDKAWEARDKAIKEHDKEINKLHKKECPNCPWNGRSIFK